MKKKYRVVVTYAYDVICNYKSVVEEKMDEAISQGWANRKIVIRKIKDVE